jgi:hypothetical protein
MKKIALTAYLIVCIAFFLVGVTSLYAKPGDFITCDTTFKKGCISGGCTQSDATYGKNCKLKSCSNGCLLWNATHTACLTYKYHDVECSGIGGGDPTDPTDPTDPFFEW